MVEPEIAGGIAVSATDDHSAAPPPASDDGDIDLSGVDPMRRVEVRRRIAVVRSFVALAAPDDNDVRRHAAMLDLSINQFKALVRAWRSQPSADSVAQSGRSKGKPRPVGPRQLDAEVKATAEAAIAGLSPTATIAQATAAVAAACEARGLAAPKATTVWKMMIAARQMQVDPAGCGVVVVGRCWIRLPVLDGDDLVTPSVALVVRAYDAAIVGASMRSDAATDAALIALARGRSDLKTLEIDERMIGSDPGAAGAIGQTSPASTIRRRLSRVLGNRIGKVQPIYKAGAERGPERLLRSRKDRPLSKADAAAVIRAAIAAHNAERSMGGAIWID
ncbi:MULTISPECIES: hypothetical protein [unclassified Sphingomonas]|jgi:hypothetical protein|uniref:hypothetical protein n=1 Tax=unclassified Sphingomonas TaxID=196159 RepID=UPI000A851CBA|nr:MULTISPECIES: hypothetical protein [unclassified Sphingomonas]